MAKLTNSIKDTQYFLKTLANLEEDPKVAVSWWGGRGCFQIKGTAAVHTSGPVFKDNVEWMKVERPRDNVNF